MMNKTNRSLRIDMDTSPKRTTDEQARITFETNIRQAIQDGQPYILAKLVKPMAANLNIEDIEKYIGIISARNKPSIVSSETMKLWLFNGLVSSISLKKYPILGSMGYTEPTEDTKPMNLTNVNYVLVEKHINTIGDKLNNPDRSSASRKLK
jgi:hypothetical protein